VFNTLRFRLTFWHALIFAGMALVIFGIAYKTTANQLLISLSEDLQDTAIEFAELYRSGGAEALRSEVESEVLSHDSDKFFASYINSEGDMIVVNRPPSWTLLLPKPDVRGKALQWFNITVNEDGDTAKILTAQASDKGWIQIGISLQAHKMQLQNIIWIFGWSLLVVVLAGILTGWWQVRHVLSAVDQVRSTAMEIGEGDLDRRLELDRHGQELVELADAFNGMLDRIQQLLGEMRDVSNHIAHDLRTPVARIRGMAESALMNHQGVTVTKDEALAVIVEESDRLSAMINTMLEIAQTDSGLTHLELTQVDIGELLDEARDLFLPVAEDAGIEIVMETGEQHLFLTGDASRLQRAISNLLDNAIKFTPDGGRIVCTASKQGDVIELVVSDTGIGISKEALPHVSERFYRGDNSRSTPGNGLGLSYVTSIVRAHDGNIIINSEPGKGTVVVIRFPKPA